MIPTGPTTQTRSEAPTSEPVPGEPVPAGPDPADGAGRPVGWIVGAVVVLVGVVIGIRALDDNSFLTHLQTGHLFLDEGVVRTDPYTYTSGGVDWIVQSWLASVVYAALDGLFGPGAIRVLNAVLTAGLAAIAWRLTLGSPSLAVRIGAVSLAVVVGATWWQERPLLFALAAFGLLLVTLEERWSPWWLVPGMWLWVNVHGSFPLALVLVGLWWLGARIDAASAGADGEGPARMAHARRVATVVVAGTLLGGIANPYGLRLLFFPVELLGRDEVLRHVTEWRSPDFSTLWARAFLLAVLAGVVALMRRPRFRLALPALVFVAAGLVASRNVTVALFVLLPVIATGLGDVGTIRSDRRLGLAGPLAGAVLAIAVVVPLATLTGPHVDETTYPEAAVEWMETEGLFEPDVRVVHQDVVGNYLEWRFDAQVPTFFDDRFEMHDPALVDDYLVLLRGRPDWRATLGRWEADVVLWSDDLPLAQLLAEADDWTIAYRDETWVVACAEGVVCAPAR